jgi:hypothetical protein
MDLKNLSLINTLEIDELQELLIGILTDKPELIPKLEVIANKRTFKKTISYYTKLIKKDLPRITRTLSSEKEYLKILKKNLTILIDLKKNRLYDEQIKLYIALITLISSKNESSIIQDYGLELAPEIGKVLDNILETKNKIQYVNQLLLDYHTAGNYPSLFNLVFQMILFDNTNDEFVQTEIYNFVFNYKKTNDIQYHLMPFKYKILEKLNKYDDLEKILFNTEEDIPKYLKLKYLFEIKKDNKLLQTFLKDDIQNPRDFVVSFDLVQSIYEKTDDQNLKDIIEMLIIKNLENFFKSYFYHEDDRLYIKVREFYNKHKFTKLDEFFKNSLISKKNEFEIINIYFAISKINITSLIPILLEDKTMTYYFKMKTFFNFQISSYMDYFPQLLSLFDLKAKLGGISGHDYDFFVKYISKIKSENPKECASIIEEMKKVYPTKKSLIAKLNELKV